MRAASLLMVFLLAKSAILWGHTLEWSGWAPAAYLWQDIAVVLVFAAFDAIVGKLRKSSAATMFYWTLAGYAAANIPVGRAVSSPLTWSMLRAARGPLADSMMLYVTWTNCVLVVMTLIAAAVLPSLLRRTSREVLWGAAVVALTLALPGPIARAHVDAHGLDRNPVAALITGVLPHHLHGGAGDWRTTRFPGATAEDLSRFSGIAKGRNVIVVSLESTAAEYLGLYGSGYDVMPNLGTLARHALIFDNAYAVYPESIKGLYSILCSAYPAFQSEPAQYENSGCRSAASLLGDAGYRTALFHSGRFDYLGMQSVIRNRGFQTLEDAGDIGGNHNSSFGVDEPSTVSRILKWIDAGPRGRPFFVTYLPIAGHHPYGTPSAGPFAVHEELDLYRNALHYGDESLGALMTGLRDRGLDNDTVWVIFGDHGEAFRQHDGNYGHTFFIYDENVRVPLLIAAPGRLPEALRTSKVVSLVDVAPTLLDFLGVEPPANYQGHSMLDGVPRMALFFTDYSLGILGLRDGNWKYIYEMESGRSKLFDMQRDPGESADSSAGQAERAAWYGKVVRGWIGK